MKTNLNMKLSRMATYFVIVEHEGVLVFVEIVKRSLWDPALDFDRTFNVLFLCQLHFVVFLVRVFPLALLSLHCLLFLMVLNVTLILLIEKLLASIKLRRFLQGQRIVYLNARVELSVPRQRSLAFLLGILCVFLLLSGCILICLQSLFII